MMGFLRHCIDRVTGSAHLQRVFNNLVWLTADKAIGILNGLLVGACVARYLGPERYGILSFGIALLAMMSPLVTLGFDKILVREYILRPQQRQQSLWTAMAARFVLGLSLYGLMLLMLRFGVLGGATEEERRALAILFLLLLVNPLNVGRLAFEAEVMSKYTVWIRNSIIVLGAVLRLYLVWHGADVTTFAAVHLGVELMSGLGVFLLGWRKGLLKPPVTLDWSRFGGMLKECWPLLLAALSVNLYMNLDIAMLRAMRGQAEAGIYSVAVSLTSFCYFLPLALASSFFPSLVAARESGAEVYQRRLLQFFQINTLAAYLFIAVCMLTFPWAIRLLYGPAYQEAIPIVCVHIWALVFVFLGTARGEHLVANGSHGFNLFATVSGLAVNFVLNLFLIPLWGGLGAAFATVTSYGVSAFLSSFFLASIRPIGRLQAIALLVPNPFKQAS